MACATPCYKLLRILVILSTSFSTTFFTRYIAADVSDQSTVEPSYSKNILFKDSLGLAIATNNVEKVQAAIRNKNPELTDLASPFIKNKKTSPFYGSALKFAKKIVKKLEKHIEKHPQDAKTYKLNERLTRARTIVSLIEQATPSTT